MTDDPQDDFPSELNSDGELSEDSLFEWDGDSWESVEHEPFYGYDEPQEWIEPSSHEDNQRADGARVSTSQSPAQQMSWRGYALAFLVFAGVVWLLIANGAIQPVSPTPSPTLRTASIVETNIAEWSAMQTQAANEQVPVELRSSGQVASTTPESSVHRNCDEVMFNPAYVFASETRILAQSPDGVTIVCSLLPQGQIGTYPQLSADGHSVYYLSQRSMREFDLQTGVVRSLFSYSSELTVQFDVSPDDHRIAYSIYDVLRIEDITADGGVQTNTIIGTIDARYMQWSPDGDTLLVSLGSRVAQVDRNGDNYSVIFDEPRVYPSIRMLAWSPDGSQIAAIYSSTDSDLSFIPVGLLVMNSDGTDVRELVPLGDLDRLSDPQWLPDGEHIAVLRQPRFADAPTITIYDLQGNITDTVEVLLPFTPRMTGLNIWFATE